MAGHSPHGAPDYYAVLGVAPTASKAEIKRAYRKLARKFHPDVSSEADAMSRIKEINEAYEVLGDDGKRGEYDQLLASPPPRARRRARSSTPFDEPTPSHDEDILRRMFGFDGNAGRDLHARLALTLEEAFQGSEQQIQLGATRRTLRVQIPPGTLQDDVLRLRAQGEPGQPPGDLLIAIDIAPHPQFRLTHADIELEVPLAPWEAVLGTKIDVPTLGGLVKVAVPPGQRSGSRLRLAKRGMPARGARPVGDQYLRFTIDVPGSHSSVAKALYEQLANLPQQAIRHW